MTTYWIVVGIVAIILIATYVVLFFYGRKRQKKFDDQYTAAKERHEVFVLSKKMSKERPQTRWGRLFKIKTYQVVGRVNISQSMKNMQMSRMTTVTFQTTKQEYAKIQVNHKYKMDVAGNYIGYVLAPQPPKGSAKNKAKSDKGKGQDASGKKPKKWFAKN